MSWKRYRFSDFLKRSKIPIVLEDNKVYKRVTIRIKNNGVSLRDEDSGRKIGTKKQFVLKAGQFIVSKIDARYGAFGIAPEETDNAIITGNFWAYDVDFSIINIEWFNQYTNSQEFYDLCERASSGITHRKYLKEDVFLNYVIELPELSEQNRIINKFFENKRLIKKVDSNIANQLNLVTQLRQAFLREAMQGKLTEDWRAAHPELIEGENSASALLERIKAEKEQLVREKKIKKQKPLPPITDEEIPFEIPEGWVWCRLGEVVLNTEGGKSPNCANTPTHGDNWGVIKTTAVQEMFFIETENKILPEKYVVNPKHIVCSGDVLITRAGPKNRVGVVCIVEKIEHNLILSDKTIRINHNKERLESKFMAYALNSPLLKPIIEAKMTGMADSQVNISQENMKAFSIPIPAHQEQKKIVLKLDSLMSYCDSLEESIRSSQAQNELLLGQVLKEALGDNHY
jgi:type I restriction enzyme S subunit